MTGQLLRRLWLPALAGAVFALPTPATAQEKERSADPARERATDPAREQPVQPQKPDTTKAEKPKWSVKVFELKHRNAEELNQILTMQWTEQQPTIIAGPGVPVVVRTPAYPVRAGVPGTAPQPIQRTSGYRGTESQLLVSFDPEAKLFFVRGPEAKVQKAEALVQALDVPSGQLKPVEFNGMHMIPVRQDKLQQVTRTLSELRINNRTTTLGDAAFVVIREEAEGGAIVEQAQTIISKYDAGVKSGTDAPKPQPE